MMHTTFKDEILNSEACFKLIEAMLYLEEFSVKSYQHLISLIKAITASRPYQKCNSAWKFKNNLLLNFWGIYQISVTDAAHGVYGVNTHKFSNLSAAVNKIKRDITQIKLWLSKYLNNLKTFMEVRCQLYYNADS